MKSTRHGWRGAVFGLIAITASSFEGVPISVSAAGPNIIPNPSLEIFASSTPGMPTSWHASSWGTNTPVFTYPVAGTDGASAAKIELTSYTDGDAKWYFDSVNVTPGDVYTFSDWYMSDVPTYVTLDYTMNDNSHQYVDIATPAASPDPTWSQAQAVVQIPTNASSVTVMHLINQVGYLTVDNFSLTQNTIAPPPPPSDPDNLITNASFESPSLINPILPDGWTDSSWGSNTTSFVYPVAGTDGVYAAKIDMSAHTDGDAKWIFAPIPVTPGDTYTFSDSYMSDVPTFVTLDYTMSGGGHQYIDIANPGASSSWSTSQSTFTVPANATAVTVYHLINQVGSLTVDNYLLKRVVLPPPPPPDPNNSILNPSFENPSIVDPSLPEYWTKSSWGSNQTAFTYPVAGVDGVKAAKIDMASYSSGDAKWVFDPINVTPGDVFTFSDSFMSNVPSYLTAEYQMSDGSFTYEDIANPAASVNWTTTTASLTVPANATKLTIFHLINQAGTLTVDNFKLQPSIPPPPPPIDPNNMIMNADLSAQDPSNPSLPWYWSKDGWGNNTSLYTYPVAGYNGGIGLETKITQYSNGDAKWVFDSVYVTPGENYKYSDYYKSNVSSFVTAEFQMADGSLSYEDVATPAVAADWSPVSVTINAPIGAQKMTVFHLINKVGTLTASAFSLQHIAGAELNEGMVTLSFDDGYKSVYDNARPILNAAGIDVTLYIVSTYLDGSDSFYMTAAQMLELNADGNEIGSHTRTHPFLSQVTAAKLKREVTDSRTELLAMGATPVTTFAYPYGDYTQAVVQAVKDAGYLGARSVESGYNDKASDKFLLMDQHVTSDVTVNQIKAWIDQAKAQKKWLILEMHQQDNSGELYSNTPQTLQSVADYINQTGIKHVTVEQGLNILNAP
ncbi:MAG: polysaccharide deacetylase family protein [Patescibacteria group bacterium]|jgi:peptidoglycan/xylan/chitin deacetylase (PgdA/CDA1 family)